MTNLPQEALLTQAQVLIILTKIGHYDDLALQQGITIAHAASEHTWAYAENLLLDVRVEEQMAMVAWRDEVAKRKALEPLLRALAEAALEEVQHPTVHSMQQLGERLAAVRRALEEGHDC